MSYVLWRGFGEKKTKKLNESKRQKSVVQNKPEIHKSYQRVNARKATVWNTFFLSSNHGSKCDAYIGLHCLQVDIDIDMHSLIIFIYSPSFAFCLFLHYLCLTYLFRTRTHTHARTHVRTRTHKKRRNAYHSIRIHSFIHW